MPETCRMDKSSDRRVPLELLAPAGNLDTALAALSAGADAVYVGAPQFSARKARGVSIEDISEICRNAHIFGAKVYVALNTILFEKELKKSERLVHTLYAIGCDALIIQDFGLLSLDLPPIPLHASTQCHNCSIEQLQLLQELRFEQAVLARELSVGETADLAKGVPGLRLETFIHGALCVSYSGRCYMSQAVTGRSANRGECAQMCRMAYDLVDAKEKVIIKDSYLLSLKDLNRSRVLPDLIKAGVTSFKIEGRMKSASYVRNITAYYRQLLDAFIDAHSGLYKRASLGAINYRFTPNPYKSFNRSFTEYQLSKGNMSEALIVPESPKSMGEEIGQVRKCEGACVFITTKQALHNGDGLCYITPEGKLFGLRVNRVLDAQRFMAAEKINIPKGTLLWRNMDVAFEKALSQENATVRTIKVTLHLEASKELLKLSMAIKDELSIQVTVAQHTTLDKAKREPDVQRIEETLTKLGGTPFTAVECQLELNGFFIPVSQLGELKRRTVAAMERSLRLRFKPRERNYTRPSQMEHLIKQPLTYAYNIANSASRLTYSYLSDKEPQEAYELTPVYEAALMTTKHCLRRHIGYCTQSSKKMPYEEPLYLRLNDRLFRLSFDCSDCVMRIYQA